MKLSTNHQPLQLKSWVLLSLVAIGFATQFAVDAGINHNVLGSRELSILLDPIAHAVLAITVVLPWVVAAQLPRFYLLLAVAVAVLIDIDHFLVTSSLSVRDAINMSMRPISHSLLFCAGLAVILGLIARSRNLAIVVFLALLTHISRDATSGGTAWLFPLLVAPRLPVGLHISLWLTIALIGVYWASRRKPAAHT